MSEILRIKIHCVLERPPSPFRRGAGGEVFKLCLIAFLFFSQVSLAQDKKILIIHTPQKKEFKKILDYKSSHRDSLSLIRELKKVTIAFHKASYLLASIDSLQYLGDSVIAHLEPGPAFRILSLKPGNVDENILVKSGFREKLYRDRPFSYTDLAKLEEDILKYSEDHGKPFATISLDSIEISSDNSIRASLNYQSGPEIVFDSIKIVGETKIKSRFLSSYLRIFPGQPFSQEKIASIDRQLRQLSYIRQTKPMILGFSDGKAHVTLFLQDRKANQADGIVGFLPNETGNKKLLVTGELNLKLSNLFGTGKMFQGEWKKFNQESQFLNLTYYHPKLLKTNLDVKAEFNLFKQDSSFLSINRNLTIYQKTGRSGKINFSGGLKTSRELISGTLAEKNSLPQFSNYNYYNYGLGYEWHNLNDYYLPRRGWSISIQGLIGNKKIMKSSGYPDSLYKDVRLESVQLNLSLSVERFIMLGKNSVFLSRLQAATLYNKYSDNIFFNDLYRIGGLKSLRGFNENYFYATTYGIVTAEYRFFTDENTYLFLFLDQGIVNNKINPQLKEDYPTGFGAGISFTTGVGTFSFIYSLGNAKSQEFNFNLSKIHFGIISRF